MSPKDMRETLIARTIAVIAEKGLDKATTKAITTGTGINEAYIYRHFDDKEHLLSKAFEKLDNELVEVTMQNVTVMYVTEMPFDARCKVFFNAVWDFLLGNREKCLAFIQYYYSPYFGKYSAEDHKRWYEPLVEKFSVAFKEEADVWMILNHILDVMLSFVIKVHTKMMPNTDAYAEQVFNVVYRSVEQYFKE